MVARLRRLTSGDFPSGPANDSPLNCYIAKNLHFLELDLVLQNLMGPRRLLHLREGGIDFSGAPLQLLAGGSITASSSIRSRSASKSPATAAFMSRRCKSSMAWRSRSASDMSARRLTILRFSRRAGAATAAKRGRSASACSAAAQFPNGLSSSGSGSDFGASPASPYTSKPLKIPSFS